MDKMKVALIIVAGSPKQNTHFWPTYNECDPGVDHNLIVVHRDMQWVPNVTNKYGQVILENKVNDGVELPHKAFGAYREYWNKYQDKYDCFAFISDDVLIKCGGWLAKSVELFESHDKLGIVGTQIFNGLNKQYPHPSHCRSPVWFGKSSALKKINWTFKSDHDGEMRIADQFLEAGYFCSQVGNKIDIAYDALENGGNFEGDHISAIMAKHLGVNIRNTLRPIEISNLNAKLLSMLDNGEDETITSPFSHIGNRKLISQLQPFDGLVYDKSAHLAKCSKHKFGIEILDEYAN